MQLFIETIALVLPVFLVIGLGTGLRCSGLLDEAFLQQTNRLIYLVFLPLLLFYKIGTADFISFFNGPLVIGSTLAVILTFVLTYFYTGLRRFPVEVRGSFTQGSFRGNLAYVGLAICFNAYGEDGLTRAGVLMGFLVPVLNLFAVLALLLPQTRNPLDQSSKLLRELALNPLSLAACGGILWSFFALPIPVVFQDALRILSGVALPLALLAIGAAFSLRRIRGDLVLALQASSVKLLLMPLWALLILMSLGVTGRDLGIGILLAGTPSATATYIMAQQLGADAELAGSIIMLSTLFSALSYTLILLLLKIFAVL